MGAPENPYAFPSPDDGRPSDGYGMTLRDYFAANAMAIVAETYPEWQLKAWFGNRTGITRDEIRAKAAYSLADAMLLQRQNP